MICIEQIGTDSPRLVKDATTIHHADKFRALHRQRQFLPANGKGRAHSTITNIGRDSRY